MTTMTDSRAVEVLSEMREGDVLIDEADYVAAIDHAIARLREPAEAQAQGGGEVVATVVTKLGRNGEVGEPVVMLEPAYEAWLDKQPPSTSHKLYTAPPSAPVGVEEMQRRLDREESDHGRTIDQRDAAEDALGRMFQAVTGRVAEWSSAWGYVDAIEEVEEHVAALAQQPATEAQAQGGGETVTPTERSVIETLLELAYAAWGLADNTEDAGGDGLTVERSDFALLEKHLNTLDELPDDQPGYTMGEAAKARWALRRLLCDTAPPSAPVGVEGLRDMANGWLAEAAQAEAEKSFAAADARTNLAHQLLAALNPTAAQENDNA